MGTPKDKKYAYDDSNESVLGNEFEENEENYLAVKTLVDDDFQNDITIFQNENEINRYKTIAMRKKKEKKKKKRMEDPTKTPINRKVVNLPASQPYIRIVDGEERLCFKYNTKISETALNAMPRAELEDNEFCVRFDLDSVDISKISEKFKADNVIYPRANVPKEMYTGNRWQYETECNKLAWQFVTLNHVLLYGKKGLIQRAVDSYRKFNKQSRNRRIVKDDMMGEGMVKRRHSESAPTTANIVWTVKGVSKKCRVRIDIENVNYEKIDEDFKSRYSIFNDDFDDTSFGLGKWESKNTDNELSVKIAYLNVDNTMFWNAVKATDKTSMLKKAVDAYKNRDSLNEYDSSDDNEAIHDVVAETLSKIHKTEEIDDIFFLDEDKS
eukprot:jgi/Antlo1/577/1478